ncbi:MAG: hypothetical protein AAFN07_06700 [Pseudomonadota bacterium]
MVLKTNRLSRGSHRENRKIGGEPAVFSRPQVVLGALIGSTATAGWMLWRNRVIAVPNSSSSEWPVGIGLAAVLSVVAWFYNAPSAPLLVVANFTVCMLWVSQVDDSLFPNTLEKRHWATTVLVGLVGALVYFAVLTLVIAMYFLLSDARS